ncbi:MAG: 30S ribosomal protein S19e [Candidatus Micrarchaeia archaeon]
MKTVYDIEPTKLVEALAKELAKNDEIKPPQYLSYCKSGSHVENAPDREDFWYVRCASILRQAYIKGRIGVGSLQCHYGGRKRHHVRSAHHKGSGGSIIRDAMQQLEKAGYLKKSDKGGRELSDVGRQLIDRICKEIS